MNVRRLLAATMLLVAGWILPAEGVRADSLIYDGLSLFSGQQSFTESFNLTSPGTLTFTLTNIPWLDAVSNLSGFLSTTSGQIGSTIGEGTETVSVGAGTYYAHWFGDAQGAYNLGVVGLKIEFRAASNAAAASIGWPHLACADITLPSSSIRISIMTLPCSRVCAARGGYLGVASLMALLLRTPSLRLKVLSPSDLG